jgi:histidyl-tRNA synthetase
MADKMADKSEKSNKLKPRLPRGLIDRSPGEIAATRHMIEKIRAVYELYGFEPVETPAIEYTDALGKFLPDQDRPNEGVFSFQDDDEQWLSLRYDLTAPLARYVAENFDTLPKPYRSYRVGYVYRNEKPGPGRFREFMQFDADTVGSSSPAADAELCMMAADTIERLEINRGDYVVKINNRKIFDGFLETKGLGGAKNEGIRLKILRAIDKWDRLGERGVQDLLGPGRKDESGDFTRGAGLPNSTIGEIIAFISAANSSWRGISEDDLPPTNDEWLRNKKDFLSDLPEERYKEMPEWHYFNNQGLMNRWRDALEKSEIGTQGLDELQRILDIVQSAGYGSRRIRIASETIRGLEYYTGPVFEVDLTFSTDSKDGSPRFGSVGGGGRYDGLISRFRSEPVPATGFSIGVSRLQAALEYLGKLDLTTGRGPVVVTVFDQDRIADYQNMVAKLRNAGIRAELYLGSGKFGPQMKYADRRNSPCVVIQGSEEKARGEVTIKDLIVGAELAKSEKGREQHLQKQAQAQSSVPEEKMVEAVREVLARHHLR